MFNFQHINNTLYIICTSAMTSLIKFYALYSVDVFQCGLNCSFQKKWFFIITKFSKFIILNVYVLVINLKCLMFVEYNICGFNCSYQRKTFKNFILNLQYVTHNWDKIADDITDQYTIYIQSIINIISFAETKLFTKINDVFNNFLYIINIFCTILFQKTYILPAAIVFAINVIFMFLNRNINFLFNSQTKLLKNTLKNFSLIYSLYKQFK